MNYYKNSKVILSKTLGYATVVNVNDDGKIVVSYYDKDNKVIHALVTKDDILSDEQYEVIRNRLNTIIDIIK